jgi:hypothetical protein
MSVMPRPKTNAKKIAYKILGKPQNLAHKPTKEEIYINRRLLYDESYRVR